MAAKLYLKLQEFVAHGANVNCLALGHKSCQVLATGGDDKKVNLWAIGKNNCIMSLSGNASPIQCVKFAPSDSHVCAGSVAGVLKVWDLEAAKLIRTLTGHKGPILAIDFHPFCDFLTSASTDTYVKLWDIRRKGCIFNYKSHSRAVSSLKFSPDGQWVTSAGEDGVVKLWDIRAGKLLKELVGHSSPITAVEFHPQDFLLSSSAEDGIINFWELEQFTLVSKTSRETPARVLHFSNEGERLYSGGNDMLRSYTWEPARTLAAVHIPWGKVHDIATTHNKLVGASFHFMNVSVWMVNTNELENCSEPNRTSAYVEQGEGRPSLPSAPFSHGQSLRKSFNKQKPTPEARKSLTVKTIEESERSETDPEEEIIADIPDVHDYRAVFQPNRTLTRSPTSHLTSLSDEDTGDRLLEPAPPPGPREDRRLGSSPRHSTYHPPPPLPPQDLAGARRHSLSSRPHPVAHLQHAETSIEPQDFPLKHSNIHHSSSENCLVAPKQNADLPPKPPATRAVNKVSKGVGTSSIQRSSTMGSLASRGASEGSQIPVHIYQSSIRNTSRVSLTSHSHTNHRVDESPLSAPESPSREFVPMASDHPVGIDFDDFLPKNHVGLGGFSRTGPDLPETEVISSLTRGHQSIISILDTRNRKHQIIHSLWKNKDLKSAVEAAVNMEDHSVVVDLLNVITLKPGIWNLDVCVAVLPTIHELLQSKYELYMKTGCEALRLVLRNFTSVIKTNVLSGSSALGVDISREERYYKCMTCYDSLVTIRAFILKRLTLQGPLGQTFRELHTSLLAIDSN